MPREPRRRIFIDLTPLRESRDLRWLLGGQLVSLLIRVELVMALCSAGLGVNTDLGTRLWPLFVLPAISSGLTGFDNPTRNAIVPRLVRTEQISTASAMVQVLNQVGVIVGPAMGGLLLAGAGADFVYWFDAASFLVAIGAAWVISPQPKSEGATRPGLRSIAEVSGSSAIGRASRVPT